MAELLAEVAAEAGWAIAVAVVLWFVARKLTVVVRPIDGLVGTRDAGARPPWQRVMGLLAAAVFFVAFTIALGWLITMVLTPVRDLDAAIAEVIEAKRTDLATAFAHVGDQIGDTPGIIAIVLIAATVAHAVTRRWSPALIIVVAVAGETSIFLASQLAISRERPEIEHLAGEPATSSFPSGHVAATIVTYGSIGLLMLAWSRSPLRMLAVVAAVWFPLAVAWARLYQGMHFPSDVLASFMFAPLWLSACWWAFRPQPRGESVQWHTLNQRAYREEHP